MLEDSQFVRIVLVLWLVSSFFVLFLLGRIDYVVHHDLYNFGLKFSFVWADPYWVLLRLVYVCLAVPCVLSVVALGLDFWKKVNSKKHVSKLVSKPSAVKVQPLERNSTLISCPSCKKTFGKPLVMLDFSSGKTKLMNVCPYCNTALIDTSEIEDEKDFETRVFSPDEKVKTRQRRKKGRQNSVTQDRT